MNSKQILISLRKAQNTCGPCKGIRYLCHLLEHENREFSYIALHQAVNNNEANDHDLGFLENTRIKMSDAKTIREVYSRIHKINELIANGNDSDAVKNEKKSLEIYIDEVVDKNYIKYFHDQFLKCRKGIKEVIRLGLKKIEKEDPELYEVITKSLVQRWNSIGVLN